MSAPTITSLTALHGEVQVMPVSFAQQRFWVLDQIEGEAGAYTIPFALRLAGDLDVEAFQQALDLIVQRHEALRTVFALEGDDLMQIVLPAMRFPLAIEDLRVLDATSRDETVYLGAQANANAPFDLAAGPLVRARLLRLGEREHVLLFAMHHIVSDGWSVGVLFDELERAYVAIWGGESPSLKELPLQYPDYAVWQRGAMQGGAAQRQIAYWKKRLQDLPTLELQTDYVRPAVQTSSGGKRELLVPKELVEDMRALARRERATPYMAFLAAFVTLLRRYTSQDDIVVGSITSGRRRAELEPLIGLFVNTLAIRVSLDGDPAFTDVMHHVSERALEAYANEDVPFEQVVEAVQPVRDRSRSPIFQAAFQLLENVSRELTLPGLRVTRVAGVKDTTKFELTLMLNTAPDGALRAVCEFNSDLFHESTIDRLLGHYVVLLGSILREPSTPMSRLPLMDAAERALLLEDWNATSMPMPTSSLHALILEQARRTPDAVAVESDDATGYVTRLTFTELVARASAVAGLLRQRGVKPGVGVGICIDRSCDLVVAMLGTLVAGGHYVPLDPAYPADRVQYMLGQSGVPVLLTNAAIRRRIAFDAERVEVVSIDALPSSSAAVAPAEVDAEDLAYVIYTSGSTGRPKGVMIPHRAVVNYVRWMADAYPVGGGDAILQKAPASFDACIWEFFLPLTTGARLVLARPNAQQDPSYIADAVERFGITVLQLVPSQLQMMLETPAFAACATLRRIFCGGEALPSELLARLAVAMPAVGVVNLYGPTETTVYSSHWALDREHFDGSAPIGRPIANTQVYVLDGHDEPVPIGVPGELCIAGRGVARGYLGQPELTAEKFVRNPFAGGTMYRTGDLARWRRDGSLEYIGRRDHQVKLRGFRIELGEIETVLAKHAGVQGAVAIVREDEPGDKRLVAYVVAVGTVRPDAAELRSLVKSHLPEFMVPSAIVFLDALPMNENGKLDRRALPRPEASDEQGSAYVAPRTPLEEQIAAVWADVLTVKRVGVEDDFFALGGHSLLAMRVIARLTTSVPVRLTIGTLFEGRTVAGLAALIDRKLAEDHGVASDPIEPRAADGPAPLSQAQETLWLFEQMHPGTSAYNVPVARRLHGRVDADALERALNQVIARHDALRTSVLEAAGSVEQVVSRDAPVELRRSDLMHIREKDRDGAAEQLLRATASEPFDLTKAPLFRPLLVHVRENEWLLLLVVHHIVFDGASISVMLRELGEAYDAALSRRTFAPPLLAIQLADFAAWERSTLTGERLADDVAFWRMYLDGAPGTIELPTDRPSS